MIKFKFNKQVGGYYVKGVIELGPFATKAGNIITGASLTHFAT
jgi:hypothetical protein